MYCSFYVSTDNHYSNNYDLSKRNCIVSTQVFCVIPKTREAVCICRYSSRQFLTHSITMSEFGIKCEALAYL